MKLLTKLNKEKLLSNAALSRKYADKGIEQPDFQPVVKFFTPDASRAWLISELDPHDPDIAFGLCDLGMGFPELGSVRMSELEQVRGRLGVPVERDRYFETYKTLSVYADEARAQGAIKG